jgi:hypothetical protein
MGATAAAIFGRHLDARPRPRDGPVANRLADPGEKERLMSTAPELLVDPVALRDQVKEKHREVAVDPGGFFRFHTGRGLAQRLGYDAAAVAALPDRAVDSFAGVGNPFALRPLEAGERVVDGGSGGGFNAFLAAGQMGFRRGWPRTSRSRTGGPTSSSPTAARSPRERPGTSTSGPVG